MRRENKLALIIGFSVLLVVAVLVSDHLSQARRDEVGDGLKLLAELPIERMLGTEPLSGSRAAPAEPVRVVAGSSPPVQAWSEPEPKVVEPLPRDDRLATRAPVSSPPEPGTGGAPVVVANGPAAERTVEASRPERNGLFDWDAGRIRALLETTRAREQAEEPVKTDGHIESAGVYVVQPGDTLYEICQRLYGDGEKWREVAALNEGRVGKDGMVYVGVTLRLLPGAKAVPAREAPRRSPAEPETRAYVVKKGDTLGAIAQRELGSVRHIDRIRDLNPSLKKNKDRILVGQTLTLPRGL